MTTRVDLDDLRTLAGHITRCKECELHATCKRPLSGALYTYTPMGMIVGEAPGKQEDMHGAPFIGKAGQELDRLLKYLAGKPRDNWFITNIVKCRPPENRDPLPGEIQACTPHLVMEIAEINPEVIVTVGRFATRFFLGNVSMDTVRGRAHDSQAWGCTIFPVLHPAAGFHNQQNLARIQQDFQALGTYLRNRAAPKELFQHVHELVDEHDGREVYMWREDWEHVFEYLKDAKIVGVDTESARGGEPWSIQLSTGPGHAICVPATAHKALRTIARRLKHPEVLTVLQNALHDLPVMEKMGIVPGNVTDTMFMAYLLQTEPLGLKDLAPRHAGMRMQSYLRVVAPATHRKAMAYLAKVVSREWPDPEPQLVWEKGEPRIKQPRNIGKKAANYLWKEFTDGKDPYDAWMKMDDDVGKAMVAQELGEMEPGYLSEVDRESALFYACRDADATRRIFFPLRRMVRELDLEHPLAWDMAALPMVVDMMESGIRVDPGKMAELATYFAWRRDAADDAVQEYVSGPQRLNVGSPMQLGKFLFEDLELDRSATKPTKIGWATGDKVLSKLEGAHPVIELIKEYRQYDKLYGTYANKIPALMDKEQRVHAKITMTRTSTGRLATSAPNLMAIPTRTLEGKMIRTAFIPAPGCVFTASDYSQIEMRIAACWAKDEEMLRCFKDDLDIHTQTAMRVFGVKEHEVDKMKHRYPCKRIGFGVLYGITGKGLWDQLVVAGLDWSVEDCDNLIKEWFNVYHGIRDKMHETLQFARRYGYVRDMWGRIRQTPGVNSSDKWTRLEAEREACNAPVQMGAAGVMKRAMGNLVPVYKRWRNWGWTCNPILQIHDDLIFEIDERRVLEILPEIVLTMESAVQLEVPTPVDPEIGYTWGDKMSVSKWEERYGNH